MTLMLRNTCAALGTALALSVAGCKLIAGERRAASMEDSVVVSSGGDTASFVAADDWKFWMAQQRAQCTLGAFRRRFMQPPADQSDLMLKAAFETTPGETEHMWTEVLALLSDSTYRVRIENEPVDSATFRYGDTVVVHHRDVTDWYAIERDTLIAGFTIRLRRERLNADQRRLADSTREYVIADVPLDVGQLVPGCK